MTRAATTLADPCTGAPRRDFLLGLRRGQLVRAHVPSWCSRHGWTLVAPNELARLASLQLVATSPPRRAPHPPTIPFVAPKSEQPQAAALVFRARDLLVRQRTQVINALRGPLAEFGLIVAKGPAPGPQLVQAVETPDEPLPEIARPVLQILIDTLHRLDE